MMDKVQKPSNFEKTWRPALVFLKESVSAEKGGRLYVVCIELKVEVMFNNNMDVYFK
jgi:hypothetical protein